MSTLGAVNLRSSRFGVGLLAAMLTVCAGGLNSGYADLFVGSIANPNTVLQYDESTGNLLADFGAEIPGGPRGILWGYDGNLYVASDSQKSVLKFDSSGNYLGVFVQSAGELNGLRGMIFDTNGNLYICSKSTNSVERYDPNGNYMGPFIAASTSPLSGPRGIVFGPDGNVYVACFGDVSPTTAAGVLKYDPNGNFLGVFNQNDNGALSGGINGLVWGPDGNLYVTAANQGGIMQYDPTGNFIQAFVQKGTSPLNDPIGLIFDGNGNLYVTDDQSNGGVLQLALSFHRAGPQCESS